MKKIFDECVCCDIPCVNCGRKETERYFCDYCGEEIDYTQLREDREMDICPDCYERIMEDEEE